MTTLQLFFVNVITFSIFPFYFATHSNPLRQVSFFVYLAVILAFGSFFGSLYSYQIYGSISISGGNLAYGAFMMNAIMLVIIERDIRVLRNVVRLVITINFFIFFLFKIIGFSLTNSSVVNPFSTAHQLFETSLVFMLLGELFIILELLLLIFLFEKIKLRCQSIAVLSLLYILGFVLVICLDGVFFPVIIFGFSPELVSAIAGNVKGKLAMALAYSVPMLGFLLIFRSKLAEFSDEPLLFKHLFYGAKIKLAEQIERQKEFLEMNKAQLLQLAQRLSLSTTSAGIGTWDLDIASDTFYLDEKCHALYGVVPGSINVSLKSWVKLIHPEDRMTVVEAIEEAKEGQKKMHLQYRIILADKSERYVETHAAVRREYKDTAHHLFGVSWDISRQKKLEQENLQLQERFYQTQKMESLGLLAGGIAHDFNNLLVPILGYSELTLLEAPQESALRKNSLMIKDSAERAANLTRQILAFSRQQTQQISSVNLNEILTDYEEMLVRLAGQRIEVKMHLDDDIPPVQGDCGQFEQVLMNLAINARDAMGGEGRLKIQTSVVDGGQLKDDENGAEAASSYVKLEVSDTGQGMSEETLGKIFEPFYTTKKRSQGTGLGLATVYGIVKQHQGVVKVESSLRVGTTFRIYLPISDETVASQQQDADKKPSFHGTETILVVEDEHSVRQLVCDTLRVHGYSVLEAATPAVCCSLAQKYSNHIDLLLADIFMPEMSGIEVFEVVKKDFSELRVLYMSGFAPEAVAEDFVHNGGKNYIQKPFSIDLLLEKIRMVLGDGQ